MSADLKLSYIDRSREYARWFTSTRILSYISYLRNMTNSCFYVNIINLSDNPLPHYATGGSSGMDIRAYLSTPVRLQPMERQLIPTGLFIELPEGYEIQVRPRSGLAIKQGITCLNSPGTVDADYRGEIKVILINLSSEPQTIQTGERIAQMVFQKVEKINWQPVAALNETQRGAGGFGHTGK
jgi:dUTP pyrophosphatase